MRNITLNKENFLFRVGYALASLLNAAENDYHLIVLPKAGSCSETERLANISTLSTQTEVISTIGLMLAVISEQVSKGRIGEREMKALVSEALDMTPMEEAEEGRGNARLN